MDSIFTSLDYRETLKTYYEERKGKSRSFSYRVFAEALGLDQSHLAKILLGQLHLTPEFIPAVVKYFHWSMTEGAYFEALVAFGRANIPAEAKLWFDRMQELRPADFRCLAAEQLEYFRHWHTPVLRALLAMVPQATPSQLAAWLRPQVPAKAAEQSITLLLRLGLLIGEAGHYQVVDAHVGTGKLGPAPLIREYHRQSIALASASLDDVAPAERDISSLVAGLDDPALEDLRTLVRDFRLSIQKRIDQVQQPDRVVQINFQLFPVTSILSPKDL